MHMYYVTTPCDAWTQQIMLRNENAMQDDTDIIEAAAARINFVKLQQKCGAQLKSLACQAKQ